MSKEKIDNTDEIKEDEGINILDLAQDDTEIAAEETETQNAESEVSAEVEETTETAEEISSPDPEIEVDVDLENPLVVHKEGDTSFFAELDEEQNANADDDDDDSEATLKRHRFKKEKKKGGKKAFLLAVLFCLVAIGAALYLTGNLSFSPQNVPTKKSEATTVEETTTSLQDKYKGTIVVKGTYIFVDGEEVDGIQGLQSAIEYEDKSTTAYTIIDENANADFLNYDVLDILTKLGFYDKNTTIKHVASTGLVAKAETTTLPPETTTQKATTTKKAASKVITKKQATTTKKSE